MAGSAICTDTYLCSLWMTYFTSREVPIIFPLYYQVLHELRCQYRDVRYSILTLALPVLLYVLADTINHSSFSTLGPQGPLYIMVALTSLGLIASAVGEVSVRLAQERSKGWNRMVRATPFPRHLYFVAKLLSQLIGSIVTVIILFCYGGLITHISLGITTWAALGGWLVLGTLPFLSIGILIGMLGSAAQPVAALGLMAFITLGGMVQTVGSLPPMVSHIAMMLPAFSVLDDGLRIAQGGPFQWSDVVLLLAYGLGSSALAVWLDTKTTRK